MRVDTCVVITVDVEEALVLRVEEVEFKFDVVLLGRVEDWGLSDRRDELTSRTA